MKNRFVLMFIFLSAFSFSPSSEASEETWEPRLRPSLPPFARILHATETIGGDQVLLFGGYDGESRNNETWIYDLGNKTWKLKSPTLAPSARINHSMADIGGDRVILFGGFDGARDGETWIYDRSDNTWTEVATGGTAGVDKPSAREHSALVHIGDGKVLLFGGIDDDSWRGDTWVYDLGNNTWSQKLPTTSPSARDDHAMASIGDDQVLLFGGSGPTNDETWVYDLSENTWTEVATGGTPGTDKPTARRQHEMAYLGGDQVLLFGGNDGAFNFNGETWVYDLSAGTWTEVAIDGAPDIDKPAARYLHAMAHLGGDKVLLFGGRIAGGYSSETWVYDFSDNIWSKMSPDSPPFARSLHAMAYRGNGQALLFGGFDSATRNNQTWVYDLAANTWNLESPSSAPSARINHGMAYLGSDQVLLFGGFDGARDGETWIYSADVPFPIFVDGFESDDSP